MERPRSVDIQAHALFCHLLEIQVRTFSSDVRATGRTVRTGTACPLSGPGHFSCHPPLAPVTFSSCFPLYSQKDQLKISTNSPPSSKFAGYRNSSSGCSPPGPSSLGPAPPTALLCGVHCSLRGWLMHQQAGCGPPRPWVRPPAPRPDGPVALVHTTVRPGDHPAGARHVSLILVRSCCSVGSVHCSPIPGQGPPRIVNRQGKCRAA